MDREKTKAWFCMYFNTLQEPNIYKKVNQYGYNLEHQNNNFYSWFKKLLKDCQENERVNIGENYSFL